MPASLARVGVFIFAMLFGITLVTERPAAGQALVAAATEPLFALDALAVPVLGAPVGLAEAADVPRPRAVIPPPMPVPAAPAPVRSDGLVLASWYGPGFFGNRTACGLTYTAELQGVAHLSLPCGTKVRLTYGGRAIVVPVVDRGPFIAGRTLDLAAATKAALGCTDLCTLRMQALP